MWFRQSLGRRLAGSGLFVLFYGDPLGHEGERILLAAPDFVVLGAGTERLPEVPRLYHAANVRVIAYVALGYGRTCADEAVKLALDAGFDGIFFDETHPASRDYNRARAADVHAYGPDMLVIMNPGLAQVDATVFDHADVVCVENQWDRPLAPFGLEPHRWMAAQGDPARFAADSAETALSRLLAFRRGGGFWYFSSAHAEQGATHVVLPPWFEEFADEVKRRNEVTRPLEAYAAVTPPR
jgi:hypothetical protein